MARGKDLIKNTGILLIAKIATQFVSFLLLPLYTAILSTEEYGRVDIYTSLAMIIIPFMSLQIEMGMFRYFITAKNIEEKKTVVTNSVIIICKNLFFSSAIFFAIVLFFRIKLGLLLYAYYISMTISTVLLQASRAEGKNTVYGVASFLSASISVALNVVFITLCGMRENGIILASIIAQIISSIYMAFRTRIYRYFDYSLANKGEKARLKKYSIPLVVNQISSWAINYSDRLIILSAWGQGANGIYSVANKFSNVTNSFFGVYNVAWTENVVRSMEDSDSKRYISKVFNLTFSVYLILVTGIINFLPFVYSIFVNQKFIDSYQHVPILLVAMLFSGMAATVGSIYIAFGKTKEVSITTMLAGICNVIVHLVLLKGIGLYAASVSTLVSFGLLFVYRMIFVKRFFDLEFKAHYLLAQGGILLYSWIAYAIKNKLFVWIGILLNFIYIIYVLVSKKQLILGFIQKGKK